MSPFLPFPLVGGGGERSEPGEGRALPWNLTPSPVLAPLTRCSNHPLPQGETEKKQVHF